VLLAGRCLLRHAATVPQLQHRGRLCELLVPRGCRALGKRPERAL
jgi:hypothetical protein